MSVGGSLFKNLEKGIGYVADGITFVLMYVVNPGHAFDEIRNCRLKDDSADESSPGKALINQRIEIDFLLQQSIEYRQLEESRSGTIDEKNKVLLTICALLVAADAAVLSNFDPKWLALIPLGPIAASVYLVLVAFQVAKVPIVDYKKICSGNHTDTEDAKYKLVEDNLKCSDNLSLANRYRVGVHLAAWRLIPLAIILLLTVVSYGVLSGAPEDRLLKALKNNEQLRKELRGPQGPPGPRGPVGPPGSLVPPYDSQGTDNDLAQDSRGLRPNLWSDPQVWESESAG